MKTFSWVISGVLAVGGTAGSVSAQWSGTDPYEKNIPPLSVFGSPGYANTVAYQPSFPNQNPMPGEVAGTPTNPASPENAMSTSSNNNGNPFSSAGNYKGSSALNNVGIVGMGLTATNDNMVSITPRPANPLILPGLLTAADPQSAIPTDRVFFNYGYFDQFTATRNTAYSPIMPSPTNSAGQSIAVEAKSGFNLSLFDVGIEKTFFNGRASIYLSVPYLATSDNTTGQPINGIGDIDAGIKVLLLNNQDTGSGLAAGLTISAPTGRDSVVTTLQQVSPSRTSFAVPTPATPPGTATFNPTYIQPYVSGVWVMNNFVVHDYLGLIIPTDERVSTFVNNDVGIAYQLYQNPEGILSSITPTLDVQFILPVNHIGNTASAAVNTTPTETNMNLQPPASSYGFSDQVFLAPGIQIGLGERTSLSASVEIPVAGPKGFNVGGTVGLNYRF